LSHDDFNWFRQHLPNIVDLKTASKYHLSHDVLHDTFRRQRSLDIVDIRTLASIVCPTTCPTTPSGGFRQRLLAMTNTHDTRCENDGLVTNR
jgi:hypothetical protein